MAAVTKPLGEVLIDERLISREQLQQALLRQKESGQPLGKILLEMGIEPFLVSSAIDCVLAQRLLRVLCDRCKEIYAPTEEACREGGVPLEPDGTVPKLFKAMGCTQCAKTGYRGRIAGHEVMLKSEEIERMIAEHRSSDEIGRVAREQGMRSLRSDGIDKVLAGVTSIEEILRVIV